MSGRSPTGSRKMDREEFLGMAGLTPATVDAEAFQPVSIGKGMGIREANRAWIRKLTKLDFQNATQLKALYPEHVTSSDVVVPSASSMAQEHFKAVVGDSSRQVYSIRSERYKPVQHADVMQAFAQASEDVGITVFGTMADKAGRMTINGFFADESCNIYLGGANKDPVMLGVRAWNSHTGTTGCGASIIGVRYLCSNLCAFGDFLGKVQWTHLQHVGDISAGISTVIKGYMRRVPALNARIQAMQGEILTLDEAECALWGITLSPYKIEAIMDNLDRLEVESQSKSGKVSLYNLWNAVNAYTTWSASGGSDWAKGEELERTQNLMSKPIDDIVSKGMSRRTAWEKREQDRAINLNGAVLVSD